ncbi:MAG TPA: hypothetical protein VMT69_01670 [Kineosporiaceae bacterium]|nr:hypothetical protein [Kineosporiaceae bacterium]
MADNSVLFAAVYDDVDAALADLDAVDQLRKADVIGKYDAAVIDKKDGEPHIVKRADHPWVRVIPEVFGGGTLPRKELHETAQELAAHEAALIVVGEPTLEKGLEGAVTRANKTLKQSFDASADSLANELMDAIKAVDEAVKTPTPEASGAGSTASGGESTASGGESTASGGGSTG